MFYHATRPSRLEGILYEGLRCGNPGDGNFPDAHRDIKDYHHAVYGFGLIEECIHWAKAKRFAYGDKPVVVEFSSKWFPFRDHIMYDVEGYKSPVYFLEHIPPEEITNIYLVK